MNKIEAWNLEMKKNKITKINICVFYKQSWKFSCCRMTPSCWTWSWTRWLWRRWCVTRRAWPRRLTMIMWSWPAHHHHPRPPALQPLPLVRKGGGRPLFLTSLRRTALPRGCCQLEMFTRLNVIYFISFVYFQVGIYSFKNVNFYYRNK